MTISTSLRVAITIVLLMIVISPAFTQEYILLGWNDLGMHCSNKNFSKAVVLPPYNNVHAQLILKQAGAPPQVLTAGYRVEYSIPNNTYSVGKTDFWTYAQQLFGLGSPLPPNIGLTGNGLTGTMTINGNFFEVTGIPVTPFPDSDLVNEHPYQLIHLVAKEVASGNVMATTDVVIPVSNEVGCVQSGCHSSEASILNAHEPVSGFNSAGPVLCASCHASNALGTPGNAEAMPFSFRMHDRHSSVAGPSNSITTCYKCHPGPNTQCLRDVMGQDPSNPLVCQNCHGTMQTVASSILSGRRPWLDEPQCGNSSCHGSTYAEESGKLFRQSKGHGDLSCSACHGSPHAIQPTVQANDNLQNVRLQGFAGTLQTCSVCHAVPPTSPGPHGIMNNLVIPASPLLVQPPDYASGVNPNPTLTWEESALATTYTIGVARDSLFTENVYNDSMIIATSLHVNGLDTSTLYFWHVKAVNSVGGSDWSTTWRFTTASSNTFFVDVNPRWNLVSLPAEVGDPSYLTLFPQAISQPFRFDMTGGYTAESVLQLGVGYWMKFPSGASIGMAGIAVQADTIPVAQGWNLIGGITFPVPVTSIETIPPGIIQPGQKVYEYRSGYWQVDVLQPGKAYWVKTSGAGSVILRAP